MKKISIFIVILTAAALILTACSSKTAETPVPQTAAQPAAIIAEGSLLPVNTLDQSFALPGQVAEVLVKDGDAVSIGQPLARLTGSPEAELALANAKLNVLNAQQALNALKTPVDVNLAQAKLAVFNAQKARDNAQERFDADDSEEKQLVLEAATAALKLAEDTLAKLEKGSGVDPDALAAAEARLEAAQTALTSSQSALDARTLTATLDGSVMDLNLQPGQRVSAGTPVITLADFSTWVVKTDNLTEKDIISVKPGQKVEIVLDALPEVTLSGEVTRINARFEEKRGDVTYTVTIKMTQTDPRMRWGMTAAVKFVQ